MTYKICKACGQEKNLESGFYAHHAMADGYLNQCKDCVKARVKKTSKIYDARRYYLNPKRKEYSKKQGKEWRENNREKYNERSKEWALNNPEKRKAHIVVGNAIRDKKIIKGPCEICGALKVEAHHDNYSEPLSVRWFCRTHHAEHHRKYKVV